MGSPGAPPVHHVISPAPCNAEGATAPFDNRENELKKVSAWPKAILQGTEPRALSLPDTACFPDCTLTWSPLALPIGLGRKAHCPRACGTSGGPVSPGSSLSALGHLCLSPQPAKPFGLH